jgi:nucleotide-binding universal stress UspA family protein
MSKKIRTIVVGVAAISDQDSHAGPGDADPVLAPAVELARSLGAALHVVHVFSLPEPVLAAYGGAPHDPAFHARCAGQIALHLRGQAARYPGGERAHCHALEGSPGPRLAELADEVGADLVIVGASRRGRLWHSILGTTAARMLRAAHVPVLVLRKPFRRRPARILLATDLSPQNGAAHTRAIETIGAAFGDEGLRFRAVYVVSYDAMLPPPLPEEVLEGIAARQLDRFIARDVRSAHPVEMQVRSGDLSGEIVRAADEWQADLLVMAARATGAPEGWLGSTTASAIRHASCNVLVVPPALNHGDGDLTQRHRGTEISSSPCLCASV